MKLIMFISNTFQKGASNTTQRGRLFIAIRQFQNGPRMITLIVMKKKIKTGQKQNFIAKLLAPFW